MEIIASGDSNFDSCEFTFDKTWDGFVKTAVFYQEKTNVQYVVLGNDDTCMIPAAAMAKAKRMYIGVFGIKGTAVITSTLGTIDIIEGAIYSSPCLVTTHHSPHKRSMVSSHISNGPSF